MEQRPGRSPGLFHEKLRKVAIELGFSYLLTRGISEAEEAHTPVSNPLSVGNGAGEAPQGI
jgi:hypothetical protein